MNKDYLTTTELAKMLGISRIAVYKKIKSGQIKAERIGRNFFIERKNLPEMLGDRLTDSKKREIDESVKKTIKEYGETIKLLGKE